MSPKNKLWLSILGIAILAVVVFAVSRPKVKSYEFLGNLKEINGNSILVEGRYVSDKELGDKNGFRSVEVQVVDDTKITKSTFLMPTRAELAKTGGLLEAEKLPRQQSTVSLSAMAEDMNLVGISLTVKTRKNIFGKTKFDAAEIIYTAPTFQEPR